MLNIIKAAVAAVVVAGSVSLAPVQALAAHRHHPARTYTDTDQGDYYGYNNGYNGYYGPRFDSRDVYLQSPLSVPGPAEEQWFDRATQSFGGGK